VTTSHDEQVERYSEPYSEPDQNAPKSSGYPTQPSVTELAKKIIELRDSISREQLAQIESVLAGKSKG
jgi:hypothetical protein